MPRKIETLSPREALALGIHIERANRQRLMAFADIFRGYEEPVARLFETLAGEEAEHEEFLTNKYEERFGGEVLDIDECCVEGVIESFDLPEGEALIFDTMSPRRALDLALEAERGAREFYETAALNVPDRKLADIFRELESFEEGHEEKVRDMMTNIDGSSAK